MGIVKLVFFQIDDECIDIWSKKKCLKNKGKCHESYISKKCKKTCGKCSDTPTTISITKSTETTTTTEFTCVDQYSGLVCTKYLKMGWCDKFYVYEQCMKTCDMCPEGKFCT